MPTIYANGINIYYQTYGYEGDYLFLIGGLTRDHTVWRNVITSLSTEYKVVVFDNRGAGQTDKPDEPYSISQLSEDLFALMSTLGIEKANIVGHSMGAFMAMHFAALHPTMVQNLVLCSACTKQVAKAKEYLSSRIAIIDTALASEGMAPASTASEADIRHAMTWLYSKRFLSDAASVDAVIRHETSNPYPQPGYAFKRQAMACFEHDATALLSEIKSPTIVISGIEDGIITPEISSELALAIPGARLEIMMDTAHMLQIENPEIFIGLLTNFFKSATYLSDKGEAKPTHSPLDSGFLAARVASEATQNLTGGGAASMFSVDPDD